MPDIVYDATAQSLVISDFEQSLVATRARHGVFFSLGAFIDARPSVKVSFSFGDGDAFDLLVASQDFELQTVVGNTHRVRMRTMCNVSGGVANISIGGYIESCSNRQAESVTISLPVPFHGANGSHGVPEHPIADRLPFDNPFGGWIDVTPFAREASASSISFVVNRAREKLEITDFAIR